MTLRRFRLRTLMILIFLFALILAAIDGLNRMNPLERDQMKEGTILFVPFLIMVVLKIGLVLAVRTKRAKSDDSIGRGPEDETLS